MTKRKLASLSVEPSSACRQTSTLLNSSTQEFVFSIDTKLLLQDVIEVSDEKDTGKHAMMVGIEKFTMTNNIPNVCANHNNQVVFTTAGTTYTVYLAEGNYSTPADIASELKTKVNAAVPGLIATIADAGRYLTVTTSADMTWIPKNSGATNSSHVLLGLRMHSSTTCPNGVATPFPLPTNLNWPVQIGIEWSGGDTHLSYHSVNISTEKRKYFYTFNMNVSYGATFSSDLQDPVYIKLTSEIVSNLISRRWNFRFFNVANGEPLDIKTEDWNMTFCFLAACCEDCS